jgi:hypothetical protein
VSNPYKVYAQAATRAMMGVYFYFNKGDYATRDGEDLPRGTRMVAIGPTFVYGRKKIEEGSGVVDSDMGLLADGFKPRKRSELGDTDKGDWDTNDDGTPRDPWVLSSEMTMIREDDNKVFIFSTLSQGGNRALASLIGYYGDKLNETMTMYPVIELQSDSYQHANRKFGKVRYPVFEIHDWVDRAPYDRLLGLSGPAKKLTNEAAEPAKIQREKRGNRSGVAYEHE